MTRRDGAPSLGGLHGVPSSADAARFVRPAPDGAGFLLGCDAFTFVGTNTWDLARGWTHLGLCRILHLVPLLIFLILFFLILCRINRWTRRGMCRYATWWTSAWRTWRSGGSPWGGACVAIGDTDFSLPPHPLSHPPRPPRVSHAPSRRIDSTWGFSLGTGESLVQRQQGLQTRPGVYDESVFRGLDYALVQARARGIRLVICVEGAPPAARRRARRTQKSDP